MNYLQLFKNSVSNDEARMVASLIADKVAAERKYRKLQALAGRLTKKQLNSTWADANGSVYAICDLKTNHIQNIIVSPNMVSGEKLDNLEIELATRKEPIEIEPGDPF